MTRLARTPLASLVLVPLIAACAHTSAISTSTAAARPAQAPDKVLLVRMPSAVSNNTVVLRGAKVQLIGGQRAQRGDTVFAAGPFAVKVALPDSAFELSIVARTPLRGSPAPLAHIEYVTRDTAGAIVTVRAEGTALVVKRLGVGAPLTVTGAAHEIVTPAKRMDAVGM